MAFFCAGSSNVSKKKDEHVLSLKDSSRRHHQISHRHPQSAPYFPPQSSVASSTHRFPAGYPNGRSMSVSEKVHDVQQVKLISDQFLQKLIVVEDHQAQDPSQLVVKKGEKVEVVRREGDMLYVRNDRGKEGYVPNRNCVPPVASTRRNRANTARSLAVRQVVSGDSDTVLKPVPMFPSNSAGRVAKYHSPSLGADYRHELPIRRVTSPLVYPKGGLNGMTSSTSSTHGVPNPIEPPRPSNTQGQVFTATTGSTSDVLQDELGTQLDSCISLNNSQNETSGRSSMSSFEPSIVDSDTRRPSSSDDSGTVEMQKEDYPSIVRVDSSSDDGSHRQGRSSSGTNTPSLRDRPLPSPPREAISNQTDDAPPPVPPRHTSLERSAKQSNGPSIPDDINPYSKPIDSIQTSETESCLHRMQQQHHVKSLMDIRNKDCGVNAPYSEVFRSSSSSREQRRQHNAVSDLKSEANPRMARRAASFTKQRVSASAIRTLERKLSPMVNGDKHYNDTHQDDDVFRAPESPSPGKPLSRFRKYLWGIFVVLEDFDACDENEVSVRAGENVMVFNQDDKDWFWVVKHKTDNSEGFIPSCILREIIATDPKYSKVWDSRHPSPTMPHVTASLPGTPTSLPTNKPANVLVSTSRGRSSTGVRTHRPSSAKWNMQQPQQRIRQRVHSTGNAPLSPKQPSNSSNEALMVMSPLPTAASILTAPSSPPPPYAELDPAPLFLSQQQQPAAASPATLPNMNPPPLPGMIPPPLPSMTRTQSQSVVRNRTYQTRSRVSTPHMYYPHPSTGSHALPSHLTRSSNQLMSPLDSPRDLHSSYPCSPTSTTGGTLV